MALLSPFLSARKYFKEIIETQSCERKDLKNSESSSEREMEEMEEGRRGKGRGTFSIKALKSSMVTTGTCTADEYAFQCVPLLKV